MMIVLGDISGIQSYVFDVAEAGGGQARRLRARSFFVQLLAEAAVLRVRRIMQWGPDSVLLCGAGKFTLRGSCAASADELLASEQREMNDWLLQETRGELRLTLAWADGESDKTIYQAAQQAMQRQKARPWAPSPDAKWVSSRLILEPLDTPCSLCGHAPGVVEETDLEGVQRRVCRTCSRNHMIGRKLPAASWLIFREAPKDTGLSLLGLGFDVVTDDSVTVRPEILAVANLREPERRPPQCPTNQFMQRRLMAHVPVHDNGQLLTFAELADSYTCGAPLLAVLKADADSLGVRFETQLQTGGLQAMQALSDRLDAFFAGRLRQELANRKGRWQPIYTIFAGGDDLIMVGPWDVMVDFAGAMRHWFADEFRDLGLTLSAGLELMKPNRPIKPAVERAELLLEEAKNSGKDRLGAFGQVWQWKDHDAIIAAARQLVEWANAGAIQRGWLHTVLELALARHGERPDPLATARLAYHVDRNWKTGTPARRWADQLINAFDDPNVTQVRYLPAIVRYALTATRSRGEED